MKRSEAYEKMLNGEKVSHKDFLDDEYLHMPEGDIETEDGFKFSEQFFNVLRFDEDWYVYGEKDLLNKKRH